MKRAILSIFVFLIIFVIGAIYYRLSATAPLTPKLKLNSVDDVIVTKVKREPIVTEINALGSLIAFNQITISPEIAGKVAKIEFKPGEKIEKGQLLFQLDDAIQRAELQSVKANVLLNQTKYQREQLLAKRGATSLQELDNAKANFLALKATLSEKQVELNKMQLRAPFSGQIGAPLISKGQYVKVGEALVTLVNRKNLRVKYSVPENYLAQLHLKQKIELSTSSFPGKIFHGDVTYISPIIDPATRTITVRARVHNISESLSPGLFVVVKQQLGVIKNALVIPEEAVVSSLSGPTVYKIVKNKAMRMNVKLGARQNNKIEVLQGLQQSDNIVIAGQQRLKNGSKIHISKMQENAA